MAFDVPGRLLAQVRPHTPELLYNFGHALGAVDAVLQHFSHPAAQRPLKWDLAQAGWTRDFAHHIAHSEHRTLVERFLANYGTQVVPRLQGLRQSVIFNDANDHNVLVGEVDGERAHIVGLIDFGDLLLSNTVCDLAIAVAYVMLGKTDPLAAATRVIAGFHEALPLTEAELEVLYSLICTRLCQSVTNSACQRKVEPNNEYLSVSEQPAWLLLEKLANISPQFAHYTFRNACGFPACPQTPAIVEWLNKNSRHTSSVVGPDVQSSKFVKFDLSVDSLELGSNADFADVAVFTQKLFEHMRTSHAAVGIGRYNEARPIYHGDQFKVEADNGIDWRTVHLGLDLFMTPDSPLFAPLDGVVHSFGDNHGHLDYGPTLILEHSVALGTLTFFTLYGHLSHASLDGLREGQTIKQGTIIGKIGSPPANGGWPPHLHFQIITDLLGNNGTFPGVGLPSQREVWLSLSPDPNLLLRFPAECSPPRAQSDSQVLAARRQHLSDSLSVAYRKPLRIVRGYRQYLYDQDGRPYLDAVNNVAHVGHCHPRVVRAGQEQMAVLNTNTRYLHQNLARYAERLVATLPEPLRVCFLVCSGSEANELALRLARTHTRRQDMVVVDVGYHGNTTSLVDISSYKFDGPGGCGRPAHVQKVPMPDVYRGAYRAGDACAGEKYARHVADAVERIYERGSQLAAFICESMLSCGGQIMLPDNYLTEAYRHVRSAGGVCIADEVQTGFGRVGTHFWAFQTQGVVPDIVTLGKPIGNGHPLGAVVTTPEIAASFNNGMEYFNTFGGNAVSCAIGLAVLDVIAEECLQANALKVGAGLTEGLRQLMDRYPLIGDVRGRGLFLGIELVLDRDERTPAPRQASYVVNRMRECGVLVSTDGPFHNVVKIKPPLVFSEANAVELMGTLDKILGEDLASPQPQHETRFVRDAATRPCVAGAGMVDQ